MDLPYRAEDLFELISDVRRYPEFVRWLHSLKVIKETRTDSEWKGTAEAAVGFKGFEERFTTAIDAKSGDLSVDVGLVRGPFRRLKNSWRITPTDEGSRIDFMIDFEFRNFILQALAAANLDYAVRRLIDAFVDEAGRRYQKVAV